MSTAIGLHHLDIVILGEALVHRNGVLGRHRGRKRVDDKQESQGISRYQDCWGPDTTKVTPKWQLCGGPGWVKGLLVGNNVTYECDRVCQADPRPRSAWCA